MSKKNIGVNYAYNLICEAVTTLLAFVLSPYLMRKLGVEQNGVFTHVSSIGIYFIMFAKLGIATYGNRMVAQYRDDQEKLNRNFSSLFILQLILSSIMLIIYSLVAAYVMQENRDLFFAYGISVASTVFFVIWLYKGIENFGIVVLVTMGSKLLTFILTLQFVKTPEHTMRYVLIESIVLFLSYVIYFILLKKYVKFVKVSLKEVFSHFAPCAILFIPILAQSIYRIMDKVMIGNMNSMYQLGLYSAAEQLSTALVGLITSFGAVMLPRISNLIYKGKDKESKKLLEQGMNIAMFFGCAVCFGIGAVAKEFIVIYYGPDVAEATNILLVLLPTILFIAWANVIRTHYIIPNRQDYIFVITICSGAVINLMLNLIFIPKYQALGAAIGTICAEGLIPILQICFVRSKVHFKELFLQNLIYFAAGAIMFAGVRLVARYVPDGLIGLLIEIITGMFIYLPICGVHFLIKRRNKRKINN